MKQIEIKHQLIDEALFIPKWPVKHLFLGTFNPEGGDKVTYFYGRARNKTWTLLSNIFKQDLDPNDSDFFSKIEKLGIACMDVIESVTIDDSEKDYVLGKGYSDAKIINNKTERKYNTDKIIEVLKNNTIIKIYSTWGTGPSLAEWKKEISKISKTHQIISLVSPSMVAKVPSGSDKYQFMLNDWNVKILQNERALQNVDKIDFTLNINSNSINKPTKDIVGEIIEIKVKMTQTYLNKSFFNIPKCYGENFGSNNSQIDVLIGDSTTAISCRVDRTTNSSRAPRIYIPDNYYKIWVQQNFKIDDDMKVEILPNATIKLTK